MRERIATRESARLWVDDIRAAGQFLTRLPVGGAPPVMPRALRAFPLAGSLIGLAGGLVLIFGQAAGLPPLAAAFVTLGAIALLTGALHEDGLADVADGFGGGRDKAGKLEIMSDSRIGTYGTLALIIIIGLRASLMAAFVASASTVETMAALIWAATSGRFATIWVLHALPAAKPDGLGSGTGRPDRAILISAALAAMPALILAVAAPGVTPALLGGVLALAATLAFIALARRQIGGQTGDVAGAGVVIAETACLAGLVLS